MCHTPFWVSLGATATVQLSITADHHLLPCGYFCSEFRLNKVSAFEARRFTSALVGFAVVFELRAGFALVAVGAAAVEISRQAVAAPAVPTRGAGAAAPLDLAVPTREARRAHALVSPGRVLKPTQLLS